MRLDYFRTTPEHLQPSDTAPWISEITLHAGLGGSDHWPLSVHLRNAFPKRTRTGHAAKRPVEPGKKLTNAASTPSRIKRRPAPDVVGRAATDQLARQPVNTKAARATDNTTTQAARRPVDPGKVLALVTGARARIKRQPALNVSKPDISGGTPKSRAAKLTSTLSSVSQSGLMAPRRARYKQGLAAPRRLPVRPDPRAAAFRNCPFVAPTMCETDSTEHASNPDQPPEGEDQQQAEKEDQFDVLGRTLSWLRTDGDDEPSHEDGEPANRAEETSTEGNCTTQKTWQKPELRVPSSGVQRSLSPRHYLGDRLPSPRRLRVIVHAHQRRSIATCHGLCYV
jgi:hypothetical protein